MKTGEIKVGDMFTAKIGRNSILTVEVKEIDGNDVYVWYAVGDSKPITKRWPLDTLLQSVWTKEA